MGSARNANQDDDAKSPTGLSSAENKTAALPHALAVGELATVQTGEDIGHSLVVAVVGPTTAAYYPLPQRGSLIIGRGDDVDIRVISTSASRRHARVEGSPATIEDLGSKNGTTVDGSPLRPGEKIPIGPGTSIMLGEVPIIVRYAPLPIVAAAETNGADDIIARDPTTIAVYELARTIASSSLSVLILGETGAGKESLAATVHRRSHRASGPYVTLNCAALTESLIDSELFGHEKGAFTGAHQARIGHVEAAHGGTLFLDEVADLSTAAQVKLLRFLECGEIVRVGGVRPRNADVRIVSATNRDLTKMCAGGTFRSDLYFRLAGMTLILPPLRERPADVLPLAHHFLRAVALREGRPMPSLSVEATAALERHHWPGNVRELRHVLVRAFTLCREGVVRPEDLLLKVESVRALEVAPFSQDTSEFRVVHERAPRATEDPPPVALSNTSMAPASPNLTEAIETLERERIEEALARCAGNQSRAAKMLGISRRVLVSRLDAYGIARPRKAPSTR